MDIDLQKAIRRVLQEHGDESPIAGSSFVGGGDINQAQKITTEKHSYFVKYHHSPPPRFFECEAGGLALLGESGLVQVPGVIGYGQVEGKATAFLVLEHIETGGKNADSAETLGRQLAELHRQEQSRYGLDHDNFIGRLPQPNTASGSWVSFYRDQRIGAQRDQADANGLLPPNRRRPLEKLMENLDEWIDESTCKPSLLHGDLWGGNWMANRDGVPFLIDPAVYVGDREADLAMTRLFGGFPSSFYAAYQEVYPPEPGYEDREPLYQLYYLLCHLNLFGESYGGSVDRVLRRYVG